MSKKPHDFTREGSGGGRRKTDTAMAKARASNAQIIAQLGVAIAILAEDMNTTGSQTLPASAAKRRAMVERLRGLTRDAAILADAAEVLVRRPDLAL
jgi:hypothetical protein